MKMRTSYFKVTDMENAIVFWKSFLLMDPTKKSQYWSEFRCHNINLGLLWTEGFTIGKDQSNFVPVFELKDSELEAVKDRAISRGGRVVVDIKDHPDKQSYVLSDPFGNEFELTRFHD